MARPKARTGPALSMPARKKPAKRGASIAGFGPASMFWMRRAMDRDSEQLRKSAIFEKAKGHSRNLRLEDADVTGSQLEKQIAELDRMIGQ